MKILNYYLIFQFFCISAHAQLVVTGIDSLMKSYYPTGQPGAVIAIAQYGKTIFKKGYGLANLTTNKSITPDENFNIGSLTKQFTAYCVLKLIARDKKLSVHDSIGRFLKLPSPLSSITIAQLLNHSSGMPDHYQFTDTELVKHATDQDVLDAMQKADSLYFPSGTRFRYSNTAYCLLGMYIEKISGMSYAGFLKSEIFTPLHLKDATVFSTSNKIKQRVTGYEKLPNGKFIRADAEESIFYSTQADGGIYISMNNYMKWCDTLEARYAKDSPSSRNLWQGQTLIDTARSLWYANGWFILDPREGTKILYHTGFNGGFRTMVMMIPSLHYCISIFSNRSGVDLEDLVSRINHILTIPDNSFIKSGPLESFIHSWPKFAPCKETSSFSTLFKKNLNAKGMVLN